jgi:hypothetical protein
MTMIWGTRRWALAMVAALMGACAMGGRCACLIEPVTGKGLRGCPCRRERECVSGRCRDRVCR